MEDFDPTELNDVEGKKKIAAPVRGGDAESLAADVFEEGGCLFLLEDAVDLEEIGGDVVRD
nr:hypothetical protein [Rhodococcus wratislaviensis]GLK41296.1 hypothetical protein GCM10017611_81720 [Rhodococcus wratislaviensis]